MKIQKSNKQLLAGLIIISMFSTSLIPVYGLETPVIPLSAQKISFNPTSSGNSSLYIVPSTYSPSNLYYSGKSATVQYTSNSAGSGNYLGTGSSSVTDGGTMPTSSTQSDTRAISNPFFPDESLPVLVNITQNATSLYYQSLVNFSLHMGHSYTFYFNHSISYIALVQTNQPFFLDVNIINPNTYINFNFTGTQYPGSQFPIFPLSEKNSIPVIPQNTNLQAIGLYNTFAPDSLVTITPLPFDPSSFGTTAVKEGQYYSDSIVQGQCYDVQTNPSYEQVLKLLNLKFFQFPVQEGNSYQINFYDNPNHYFNSTYMSCPQGSLIPVSTDFPTQFNYIQNNLLSSNSVFQVSAKANGFINMTLIGAGLLDDTYGFYFTKIHNITLPTEHVLQFNQPIGLKTSPNDYYTFNIATPSMFAINYTSSVTLPSFKWSWLNTTDNTSVPITTSNFHAESGNLVNDSSSDLVLNGGNYNWIYLPAGHYRLDIIVGSQDISTSKYEFNLVPVQTFSASTSLSMNINSIYALQLPINPIDYNYVNASTTAHDNLTVQYQWGIIGKYSSPGSTGDTVNFNYGSFSLGNQENNGNWTKYPANTTTMLIYAKPTRTNFVPILMIRPYVANRYVNVSYTPQVPNFSTSIGISVNTPASVHNQYYDNGASNGYNAGLTSEDIGLGIQYVVPGTVSTSQTVFVNDNVTYSNTNHQYAVYAFTLSTTADQLYNVTVSSTGNFSSVLPPADLNATITSVYVHSGNLIDTHVFSEVSRHQTNYTDYYSQLFLTSTAQSYLFVRLFRTRVGVTSFIRNATLVVTITKIATNTLNLDPNMINYSYNSTISKLEVLDTTPLWTISSYSYPGSGSPDLFVPLLLISGGVIVIAAGAGGIYYFRKRGGLGGGKFPR